MAGILPHLSSFYFIILSESAGILPRLYIKLAFYEYLRTLHWGGLAFCRASVILAGRCISDVLRWRAFCRIDIMNPAPRHISDSSRWRAFCRIDIMNLAPRHISDSSWWRAFCRTTLMNLWFSLKSIFRRHELWWATLILDPHTVYA